MTNKENRGPSVGAMTIGQLARAAGINVETIRYYQRRGLIPTPSRPLGGQRSYPEESLRQIAFIHRAQALGFTLDEIIALQGIARDGARGGGRELAEKKLDELERRVTELNRMRRALRSVLAKAEGLRVRGDPVLRILLEDEG